VSSEVQKHKERTPPKPDDEERREMPASSSSGVPFQSKLSVALCRALVKCSKRFEVQIQRLGLDALPETELTLLRYLCPNYLKSVQISASGDGEPPQGTPPTHASSSSEEEEEEEEEEENDVLRKEGTAATSQRNTKTKPESHLLRRDILNEFRKPLVVKKGDAKRAFDRRIDAAIGVLSTLNERTALLEKTPAKSRSTCVTRGVRVTASSSLIPEQSSPREQRFVYAYNVRIENESMTEPVQLISRRFEITDENGGKEFVDGHGVIGKQPILDVGEKFEYTSAVPLKHLKGQMTGGYLMASQRTGTVFEAKLESFALKPQELKKAREEEKDAEASKVATTTTGKGRRSRVM
jgi:ApaG protein